jgi:hypothetical protein
MNYKMDYGHHREARAVNNNYGMMFDSRDRANNHLEEDRGSVVSIGEGKTVLCCG